MVGVGVEGRSGGVEGRGGEWRGGGAVVGLGVEGRGLVPVSTSDMT